MRILMSMFGWADSGGGTIFPRQLALELQRRGHQVMVIYAGVPRVANAPAYAINQHEEDGVQLIGIHNRPALFLDDQAPRREIHDPEVVRIFEHYFKAFAPDLVHYHNFLGLSLGIAEVAHAAGVPSLYTPYNFWLLCPTLYLNLPDTSVCRGVNVNGTNCLSCTRASLAGSEYVNRRDRLRADYLRMIGPCLATSENVRELLVENGYPQDKVEILKLGNDRAQKIWHEVGQARKPGLGSPLRIGFMGSLLAIKGVHNLVAAAQFLQGEFKISLHGEGPEDYVNQLRALDRKGVVDFAGRFADADHGKLLSQLHLGVVPSICFDHSPLVIGEFQAARVPVVGARIGGIPDYIQPGTGAMYEAGDIGALASALQSLIDDPAPILDWQAAMLPPLSYNDYVDTLEQRYAEALRAGARQRLESRAERFLRQRRKEQTIYSTPHLLPKAEADSAFGLDLHSEAQLTAHSDQIGKALWISVSEPALLCHPSLAGKTALSLPPWRGQVAPAEIELPTEKRLRVLLPFGQNELGWQAPVQAWLEKLDAETDAALVLLPLGDPQTCQEQLVDFIESLGEDTEGAEMILLEEAGSDLAALAPRFDLLVLTQERQDPWTLWPALNGKAIMMDARTTDLPALLHEGENIGQLSPWTEALGWRICVPDQDQLRSLFEKSAARLVEMLESLKEVGRS